MSQLQRKGTKYAVQTAPPRTAAKRERSADDCLAGLAARGIAIAKAVIDDVAEEAGHAYKDVDSVMADAADLVEPVYRLTPMGVLKG